ncbi:MAG: hypothetical protein P9M04_02920 [Candidatus Orphnella occulta]|nr:hypothetical protein [Candidatus Orphnella occulta]
MIEKKSLVIKILGWVVAILALERLVYCVSMWVAIEMDIAPPPAIVAILFGIAFYLCLLRAGFLVIHLSSKGRKRAILFAWLFMVFGLLRIMNDFMLNHVLTILVSTFYIYYFTRPKIKEQFKTERSDWLFT